MLSICKELSKEGITPDHVTTDLRNVALASMATTARLRSALRKMLPVIQQRGTEVIVLKGAAVASLLYDEPGLRPSRDIDLLCREGDYGRVWATLVAMGYQTDSDSTLPPRLAPHETYFERHFFHPEERVHVELHVDCIKLGLRPRHSDSIWSRARPIEIDDVLTLALSPEDQVLTLSVHVHRHGFTRLIWLKDIDLLIRKHIRRLDWQKVIAGAREEGAEASLWVTLSFLQQMFSTPLPREIMPALKPNWALQWLYGRIWPDSRVLNLAGRPNRLMVQFNARRSFNGIIPSLLTMGRRREKLAMLVRRLVH